MKEEHDNIEKRREERIKIAEIRKRKKDKNRRDEKEERGTKEGQSGDKDIRYSI